MKGMHKYILFIVVLVAACFILGQRMPRQFVWEPTFAGSDRQPFGCYVFDSVMAQSMHHGYTVQHKTFSQISSDTALRHNNLLVLCDYLNLSRIDLQSLDRLMRNGSHVMIAVGQPAYAFTDSTLAYNYGLAYDGRAYFSAENVKRFVRGQYSTEDYDTLLWSGNGTIYPPMRVVTFRSVSFGNVIVDQRMCREVKFDTLMWKYSQTSYPNEQCEYFRYYTKRRKEMRRKGIEMQYIDSAEWFGPRLEVGVIVKKPLAVTRLVGKGRLTIVAMPFALTNYGVLNRQLSPIVMRLMTQIADCPVVRTTAYMNSSAEHDAELSPMRYVLSHKQLRHAWYLAALILVLFCAFKARRQQRVIPVISKPRNHSLEFAKLIGTLYYQHGDNTDIVRKKFAFLAEHIRAALQIDILGHQLPPEAARKIAMRTGLDEVETADYLRRLRLDYWTEGNIDDREMKWAIDCMERIMKLI